MARRDWIVRWIIDVLEGRRPEADFDSALGRLSFVCGAIIYDRPLLAPLYSLGAATRKRYGTKVNVLRLPPFAKFILLQLECRLLQRKEMRCRKGRAPSSSCTERFRSDAKVEGEDVTVGGYQTYTAAGVAIPHKEAKWFMMKLDRSTAPWAYGRGEPYRAIASLELPGS